MSFHSVDIHPLSWVSFENTFDEVEEFISDSCVFGKLDILRSYFLFDYFWGVTIKGEFVIDHAI